MDSATYWMNSAGKRKLSVEATNKLFEKLSKQEKNSKKWTKTLNQICEGNLLLVVSTVSAFARKKRIKTNSPLFADLLQVGYLGLRYAAERYDAKRAKFSTCAYPWILQQLGRHVIKNEQSIYVPENCVRELYYYLYNGKMSARKGAPKTLDYVMSAAFAYSVKSLDSTTVSQKSHWRETSPLLDLIASPDKEENSTDPSVFVDILKQKMDKASISPEVQSLMIAYAHTGHREKAARKVRRPIEQVRKEINATIKTLQQLDC